MTSKNQIKLSIGEIIEIYNILIDLSLIKTCMWKVIGENIDILYPFYKEYSEYEYSLLKKHANLDENGNPIIVNKKAHFGSNEKLLAYTEDLNTEKLKEVNIVFKTEKMKKDFYDEPHSVNTINKLKNIILK